MHHPVEADDGDDVGLVLEERAEPHVAAVERLLVLDLRRDVGHRREDVRVVGVVFDEHGVELHPHERPVGAHHADRMRTGVVGAPFEAGHALGDGPLDLARADERGRVHADEVGDVGPEDLGVGRVARQERAVEADRGNGGRGAPEVGVEATLRGRGLSIRGHASLSDGMHHDLTNFGGAPEPAPGPGSAAPRASALRWRTSHPAFGCPSLALYFVLSGWARTRSLERRARKGDATCRGSRPVGISH